MASANGDKPQTAAPSSPPHRRRSSLVELFANRATGEQATKPQPTAMSAAMAQQAQEQSRSRRLSITTLGLSGSPTQLQQGSPFANLRRGKSTSAGEASSGSAIDDDIDDGDSVPPMGGDTKGAGSSPPARRMSFGARAYRDARSASITFPANGVPGGGGGSSSTPISPGSSVKASSPPGMKGRDGFNWTENFRTRAERASVSAASGSSFSTFGGHNRTKSQSISEPAPPALAPKPAQKAPDHFQERILKGDFYMD